MLWFYAETVTINNGSFVVQISSNEDVSNVSKGDGIIIGSFSPVEIKSAYVDNSNNKFIELEKAWGDSNQTNVKARVYFTAGDFIAATKALQEASALLSGNFSALDVWGTDLGTVDFTNQDGDINTARTLRQMDADVKAIQDGNQAIIDNAVSDSIAAIRYGKLDNPLVHLFKKNKLVDTLKGELSWTRDSGATKFGQYGKLQYSPSPYATNHVKFSEDFAATAWDKNGSTTLGGLHSAPDGSMTAQRVDNMLLDTNDGSGSDNLRQNGVFNATQIEGATFSIFVKSVYGKGLVGLRLRSGSSGNLTVQHSVSEEWQRLSVTIPVSEIGQTYRIILGANESILVWGAQLEESKVANGYVKTEDVSISGSSYVGIEVARQEKEGWLYEGASTNLLTQSGDITSVSWNKVSTTTPISTELKPDGAAGAVLVTPSTDSSSHYVTQSVAISANKEVTLSMMVKAGGYNFFAIQTGNVSNWGTSLRAVFDLSNGTVSDGEGNIKALGGGWYRCSITSVFGVADSNGGINAFVYNNSGLSTFAGDGVSGVYMSFPQIEELPFASSYIPTTDTPATRAADIVEFNPVGNMPHAADEFTIAYSIHSFADKWRRHWGVNQYQYLYSRASAGGDIVVTNPNNSIATAVVDTPTGTKRSYVYAQDSDNRSMYIKSEGVDGIYRYQAVFNDVALDYPEPTKFVIGNSGHAYNSDEAVFGHFSDFRIYDFGFNDLEASFLTGE